MSDPGYCILMGFRRGGGSGPGVFEEWAAENLVATGDIPARVEGRYEWMLKNFISTSEDVPRPLSDKQLDVLIAWAKEYFVTVNEL